MYHVKRVTRTEPNRRIFRSVSRESCGETCNPPDNDRLLFVYEKGGDRSVIGVASYQPAHLLKDAPADGQFLSDYYHTLTFIFVMPYYKGQGIGGQMLRFIVKELRSLSRRPIRIQSAERSSKFFARHGFVRTGEVVDCVCGGSPLFSRLVNMQKTLN